MTPDGAVFADAGSRCRGIRPTARRLEAPPSSGVGFTQPRTYSFACERLHLNCSEWPALAPIGVTPVLSFPDGTSSSRHRRRRPNQTSGDRSAWRSPSRARRSGSSILLCAVAGITFEIRSAQAGAAALMQALRHAIAECIKRRRRHRRRRRALCRRSVDDGASRHRKRGRNPDLHIRRLWRYLRRCASTSDCAARCQYDGKQTFHDRPSLPSRCPRIFSCSSRNG
jgi:hypothetical protein